MKSKTMRISIRACTFALLSVLLFFGIWACKKDATFSSDLLSPKEPTSLEVNNAKSWFESTQSKEIFSRNAKFRLIQPQWHQAFVVKGGVEIPILSEGKLPMVRFKDKTEPKGRQRLVLLKTINGYKAVLTSYMPSKSFIGKLKDINIESFLREKFDGMVSFQYLND